MTKWFKVEGTARKDSGKWVILGFKEHGIIPDGDILGNLYNHALENVNGCEMYMLTSRLGEVRDKETKEPIFRVFINC